MPIEPLQIIVSILKTNHFLFAFFSLPFLLYTDKNNEKSIIIIPVILNVPRLSLKKKYPESAGKIIAAVIISEVYDIGPHSRAYILKIVTSAVSTPKSNPITTVYADGSDAFVTAATITSAIVDTILNIVFK